MEKTANLNVRVTPAVKQGAEAVLKQLGIPMSVALELYLNQIALVGGIPFDVRLPSPPKSINAELMTRDELEDKLRGSVESSRQGRVRPADDVFSEHREWFP